MRIQLYDRGTAKGKQLFTALQNVCQRLQIEEDPEMIRDMNRVYSQGVMGETILMINDEIVLVDKYPSQSELEKVISDYL